MKKISTLFTKDPNDLGRIINVINPENQWVFDGEGIATRKFDGTAATIIGGEIYKRYDVKRGRAVPEGAIPCQEPDTKSGHHPHWLKCDRSNAGDQFFFEAFDKLENPEDGTYELCGPKVQNNREQLEGHELVPHGADVITITDFTFEGFRKFLENPANDIEGIVFHHKTDGRMCKIRKRDFGVKR